MNDLREYYSIMSIEADDYCAVSYSAHVCGWACDAPSSSYLLLVFPSHPMTPLTHTDANGRHSFDIGSLGSLGDHGRFS